MFYTLIVWSALCTAADFPFCETGDYITVARSLSDDDCAKRLDIWLTLGEHQRGVCYKEYK